MMLLWVLVAQGSAEAVAFLRREEGRYPAGAVAGSRRALSVGRRRRPRVGNGDLVRGGRAPRDLAAMQVLQGLLTMNSPAVIFLS